MKKITIALAVAGVFLLTGCEDLEAPSHEEYIELGKKCYDAGGDWTTRDTGRYQCEFKH